MENQHSEALYELLVFTCTAGNQKLTTSPGVYLMKDQKSEIIYIGKAKNLKNRVTSYFQGVSRPYPKVASMVEHGCMTTILLSLTRNMKPLFWSAALIKQHQRNITFLLKDDKGVYPSAFRGAVSQTDGREKRRKPAPIWGLI